MPASPDWRRLAGWLSGALFAVCPLAAQASYPDQPVRVVVPHSPGGFNDAVSRLIAKELSQKWGQPVIVENRPGASQQIGTAAVAAAAPDGYTLLNAAFSHGVNAALYPQLSYDTARDFVPVAWLGQSANMLVVNAGSPHQQVSDLLAAARAKPGALTYGSSGAGSSPQLSAALFALSTGTELTHVPYKGSAPMVTDLLAGHIDLIFDNVPNVAPHVRAGKLRALAVTSAQRVPGHPDLPTLAESGLPDYEMVAWYGWVAPRGTPEAIVNKINADVQAVLETPSVQAWFAQQGVEPVGGDTATFGRFIDAQLDKWGQVIKAAGISAQ